jgi:hypothetical protein
VTTQDDIATVGPICTAITNDFDESAIDDTEDDDPHAMYPRPLTVSRPNIPEYRRSIPGAQTRRGSSPIPIEEATRLAKDGMIFELGSVMDSMAHEESTFVARSSFVGKTLVSQASHVSKASSAQLQGGVSVTLETRPLLMSRIDSSGQLAISEPPITKPTLNHLGTDIPTHGTVRSPSEAARPIIPKDCSGAGSTHISCHPDTWTDSQGEPDSDPFCPQECDVRHSHEVVPVNSRPIKMFRQSTSGTVLVLDRVESVGSEESLGMVSTSSGEDEQDCVGACVLQD